MVCLFHAAQEATVGPPMRSIAVHPTLADLPASASVPTTGPRTPWMSARTARARHGRLGFGVRSSRREDGKPFFEFGRMTSRALRDGAGAHQGLELLAAAVASVFIDRHGNSLSTVYLGRRLQVRSVTPTAQQLYASQVE